MTDDKQIDILFKHIDELLLDSKFELVDSFIGTYDISFVSPTMLIALLSITKAAKDRLTNRDDLVNMIYGRLEDELGHDKATRLLANLI